MKIEQIDRQWSSVSSDCLMISIIHQFPNRYQGVIARATSGRISLIARAHDWQYNRSDCWRQALAVALQIAGEIEARS